jgi:hypothetical protein
LYKNFHTNKTAILSCELAQHIFFYRRNSSPSLQTEWVKRDIVLLRNYLHTALSLEALRGSPYFLLCKSLSVIARRNDEAIQIHEAFIK